MLRVPLTLIAFLATASARPDSCLGFTLTPSHPKTSRSCFLRSGAATSSLFRRGDDQHVSTTRHGNNLRDRACSLRPRKTAAAPRETSQGPRAQRTLWLQQGRELSASSRRYGGVGVSCTAGEVEMESVEQAQGGAGGAVGAKAEFGLSDALLEVWI